MKRFLLVSSIALAIASGGLWAQDADLPAAFAKTGLTKEQFMAKRAEAVAMRRGLHEYWPFDRLARAAAIGELEAALERRREARFGLPWLEIGPDPIPNAQVSTGPQTTASGRTISIEVHPTDPDIVYVGTAQGGLYRSTDGGTNWTRMMDGALSLAIGAIAIAPSQPETIYVGTGEPNFSSDSFFGVGVYRIDNASSGSPIISGPFNQDGGAQDIFSGRAIGGIAVDPTDAATIFVGSTSGVGGLRPAGLAFPNRGVYRSTNATSGSPTFTQIPYPFANQNLSARDLAIDPDDANVLVANVVANGGGIIRSTNALSGSPSFTLVETFSSGSTSELTAEFAAVQPVGMTDATFYAATGNGGGRVLRSTDGGATWSQRIDNDFCSPQCFYDIAVDVDPTDSDNVFLGGAPSFVFGYSTNGGAGFTESNSGVHVDTHAIGVAPSNPSTIYLGTDGGIYKTTNGGTTWTSLNNSQFTATQFMDMDVHPTDPEFSLGGTQDNGTNFHKPDSTWFRADFGDGGFTVIDQNASDTTNVRMYHTYFNAPTLQGYGTVGSVGSAVEGFWSFRGCQGSGSTANGITCNGTINFYAPLVRGPGNPNTIYYGSDRLYRSANTGTNHTVVSQNPISSGVPISAIGIAPSDDDVRAVGLNNGELWGTSTGSSSLSNLDPVGTVPNVPINRITIDPNSATTAYVALSVFGVTNVWRTTNLNGSPPTWTAAAGAGGTALPQVPVNDVVVDPADSNTLYAGTDIGVYVSTDAGSNWAPLGTGLPRVAVFATHLTAGGKLRIATHGRGMWEYPVDAGDLIFADGFESGDVSSWSGSGP